MAKRRGLRATLLLLLLGGALWQFGSGVYIQAKAMLAQHLLRSAWADRLDAPDPAAARNKPWPWADTWPVARLLAPRLDIDLVVLAGDSGRTLAFGPGHRFGTAAPGEPGLSLVSAHRDTHFRFLQHLHKGDSLLLETARGEIRRFRVMETRVIDARQPLIRPPRDSAWLALATCYPFDAIAPGGPLRYLVLAREIPAMLI